MRWPVGQASETWIGVAFALAVLACDPSPPAQDSPAAPAAAEVDPQEVERLQALGYVDVVDTGGADLPLGVLLYDRARTQPGPVFFTNARGCSARLIARDGAVLRSWQHAPCRRWENAILLPDGDLIALHRNPAPGGDTRAQLAARRLLRFDANGGLRWERALPVHHDVDATPGGRLAALGLALRSLPELHPTAPIRDHEILRIEPDGRVSERASLVDVLRSAPDVFRLREVRARVKEKVLQVDLLHANSIEWMRRPELARRAPLYGLDNVLVCLRHQHAVVIVDWAHQRPLWAWGPGELLGPHDATLLANGHVLIFDNGLGRGWSRVVEVDPLSDRIVWSHGDPDAQRFYSATRGAAQRLPNGNTLITSSAEGLVFEVTPQGERVWALRNPNLDEHGKPVVIVRARRVPASDSGGPPYGWSD